MWTEDKLDELLTTPSEKLVADMTKIIQSAENALDYKQLQPILC